MYEEYFGLSAKPFQLSPDARFFYPSNEHKRALSFLQYGLGQADGFIVITGDVGTGKTTLVQTLLDDLDSQSVLCANLVTTQLEENDLLSLVCINLGIKVDQSKSKAILLDELQRFFSQRAAEGRRVLLIVDEAQNLPARSVEELRMLSNFTHDRKPLVQVFLLGQEEFRATLLSEGFEQLRQRVIATYHLNPLTENETRTYIEHRLVTAGWAGNPHFTDDAFSSVFEFAEGVPRRINNLCDRLLLFSFLEERSAIDLEVVKAVADEIGSEFWGRSPVAASSPVKPESMTATDLVESPAVFNTPGQAHNESMAKIMFDKADIQQRLSMLEHSVETLSDSMHEELSQIRSLLLRMVKTQARLLPQSPRSGIDVALDEEFSDTIDDYSGTPSGTTSGEYPHESNGDAVRAAANAPLTRRPKTPGASSALAISRQRARRDKRS